MAKTGDHRRPPSETSHGQNRGLFRGHGQPEDVGGPRDYGELLGVLADPSHEDFEHYMGWTGGGFDPEDFSLAAANVALQRFVTP